MQASIAQTAVPFGNSRFQGLGLRGGRIAYFVGNAAENLHNLPIDVGTVLQRALK
jgi:hypothetical protein